MSYMTGQKSCSVWQLIPMLKVSSREKASIRISSSRLFLRMYSMTLQIVIFEESTSVWIFDKVNFLQLWTINWHSWSKFPDKPEMRDFTLMKSFSALK